MTDQPSSATEKPTPDVTAARFLAASMTNIIGSLPMADGSRRITFTNGFGSTSITVPPPAPRLHRPCGDTCGFPSSAICAAGDCRLAFVE